MKDKILQVLKESKDYVSGQSLCQTFGVSRTAVWKAIGKLEEEGYRIEAIRNKGYRLLEIPDALTNRELERLMPKGIRVEAYDQVDSTNEVCKKIAKTGNHHGTLVVAEQQTGGKGRRGRAWESPHGTGIWMSLLIQDEIKPERASMLTLVAAMAIRKGILEATGLDCEIKWPNDIVYQGRKVCGILTEMSAEEGFVHYIVIGIGINCNTESFSEELKDKATSILLSTGEKANRGQVIKASMEAFLEYYEIYKKTQDMSGLMEEYNSYLANRGKPVMVLLPGESYQGIGIGLAEDGALLVQTETGTQTIYSGEVSVRGIYGYV